MWVSILLAALLFGIVVTIHELGHFLLAKKHKIRVSEFSVGMGPRLISKVVGETRYSLKLIPIGGSCMMGEDDVEDMEEGSFNSKSVGARISVIAAGPIFNIILAFIFSVIIIGMVGYDAPTISQVVENSPASQAGLKAGDEIVEVNNRGVDIFRDLTAYTSLNPGKTLHLAYERDGERHEISVKPKQDEDGAYRIGVSSGGYQKATPLKALEYGLYEVKYWVRLTFDSLKMLVTGQVGIKQMMGPVGIVDVVDDTYQASKPYGMTVVMINLLNFAILLTANLGVMNLLPLPALDGGRLVFMFIEAIRGKRVPPEKEGMVHLAGLILLFGLMLVVMFNDIVRIIG